MLGSVHHAHRTDAPSSPITLQRDHATARAQRMVSFIPYALCGAFVPGISRRPRGIEPPGATANETPPRSKHSSHARKMRRRRAESRIGPARMTTPTTESASGRPPDDPAWTSEEEPPSSWVAFWPEKAPPERTDVAQALATLIGGDARIGRTENPADAEDMLWNLVVEVPSIAAPVVIWAERAAALPTSAPGGADETLARCPWVVRMQAQLGTAEPASDYFVLSSLLAGAIPDAVAILDVASGVVFERAAIDEWFLDESARPNERWLWSVLGLTAGKDGVARAGSRGMLFTTGLRRCGRPEIEIVDLPAEHMDAGVALLNAVAGQLLERAIPAPGEPVEIGPGLSVVFQPWTVVAGQLDKGAPGSRESRDAIAADGPSLDGVRAVVCDAERVGSYRPVWSWPRAAIERLEAGNAVFYSSPRRADATAARARRTWSDFATAFASLARSDVPNLRELAKRAFMVQAPIAPEGAQDEASHEQAWFRVEGFDAGLIRAALCAPSCTRPDLREGHAVRLAPSEVRDWRVSLDERDFGPEDPAALLAEVDRLRGVA